MSAAGPNGSTQRPNGPDTTGWELPMSRAMRGDGAPATLEDYS
jgi:hypothetical protein